jgi:hypothetical protein
MHGGRPTTVGSLPMTSPVQISFLAIDISEEGEDKIAIMMVKMVEDKEDEFDRLIGME